MLRKRVLKTTYFYISRMKINYSLVFIIFVADNKKITVVLAE